MFIDNAVNDLMVRKSYSKFVSSDKKSQIFVKFVGKLEVKPQEQPSLLLGNFTSKQPAKGFSIQLDPDPNPAESIVIQITRLGTDKRYRLVLHVANYGTKTVHAEVWSI